MILKNSLKISKLPIIGIGPMSKNCVDATIELADKYKSPLMLIASRRQIDSEQFGGGYVENWTTKEFADYVIEKDVNKYKSIPAILPIDKKTCNFTSGYGMRRDPITGRRQFHEGHDFSAHRGTPVYATGDGIIKISSYFGSYGNYIEIDHGYGLISAYGHLNKRNVKKGRRIIRGTKIGTVGNTGKSTAPHLHYEIKEKGRNKNPADYYFSQSHI